VSRDKRKPFPLDSYSWKLYTDDMKLVVQIQLIPDADAGPKLRTTIERFNAACNWIAGECFSRHEANVFEIRKFAYHPVRERFGLSSQMAQLAIKAVSDAYKRDRSIRPVFRKHAAMSYDARTMSFKGIDRVSLLTLESRVVVPFVLGSYQAERLELPKGQGKLVLRKDGKWFLIVTVEVPEETPIPVTDFIGIDLGIKNIATDSDGNAHTGEPVEKVRKKHKLQRRRLQRRNTKGAKKKLQRLSGKEARFRKHQNHVISKTIVGNARRTDRGIALEDLTHILTRVTAQGSDNRDRLKRWSFFQLRKFIAYKAKLAGVPVVFVNPQNTSQTCAKCRHSERANRKSQSEFSCRSCGHQTNADQNAALNIKIKALGLSKQPIELEDLTV
jgi:putative transposase